MPSAALTRWQNDRMPHLVQMDAQCDALLSAVPPPLLAEASLQMYVMLLSGHFQGFCRDLYSECLWLCVDSLPERLRGVAEAQFSAELRLNSANPTVETIRKDFERFNFRLDLVAADPANAPRVTHLGHLNYWRNASAHQKSGPPPLGIPSPIELADVRNWRASCDGLALSLDAVMQAQLLTVLGVTPS